MRVRVKSEDDEKEYSVCVYLILLSYHSIISQGEKVTN